MDREKIINDEGKARWRCTVCKGLQEAADWLSTETSLTVVEQWVVRDALALLKAQEPVKPRKVGSIGCWQWYCGACGMAVEESDNYCHECGQAVKWE